MNTQSAVVLVRAVWQLLEQMAPYLLLGFAVAGGLSVFLTESWVRRHLTGRPVVQAFKAALFGVPLPLCSCGILPVALALRSGGAGRGATFAFLASTPQTGVDSLLATASLLGGIMALFRASAAFVSGFLAGILAEFYGGVDRLPSATTACCCGGHKAEQQHAAVSLRGRLVAGLRYGFWSLPGEVALPLLTGILISAVLTVWMPADTIGRLGVSGFWLYLAALAVGIPLYACSMAVIPIGAAMLHAGVCPGAVLVFLITAPATNAASLMTLGARLGWRATGLYLAAIIVTALAFGMALDFGFPELAVEIREACTSHDAASPVFNRVCAVMLLTLLIVPALARYLPAGKNRRQKGAQA